ncbi:unnamed protein product, partial [marine sediment metagenome]
MPFDNTNTKRFTVAELDFDAIKDNLKAFLAGKQAFTDYDL